MLCGPYDIIDISGPHNIIPTLCYAVRILGVNRATPYNKTFIWIFEFDTPAALQCGVSGPQVMLV